MNLPLFPLLSSRWHSLAFLAAAGIGIAAPVKSCPFSPFPWRPAIPGETPFENYRGKKFKATLEESIPVATCPFLSSKSTDSVFQFQGKFVWLFEIRRFPFVEI